MNIWNMFVLPVLICVVLPVMVVWLVLRARQHAIDKKAEIMLKAIESGTPIDPEYFKPKENNKSIKKDLLEKLNGACITGLMGVDFLTLGIIRTINPSFGGGLFMNQWWLPAGGILLAVGIGLFISYFAGKKMLAKEMEAEEKQLEENK